MYEGVAKSHYLIVRSCRKYVDLAQCSSYIKFVAIDYMDNISVAVTRLFM
jgi:hypothetical protein